MGTVRILSESTKESFITQRKFWSCSQSAPSLCYVINKLNCFIVISSLGTTGRFKLRCTDHQSKRLGLWALTKATGPHHCWPRPWPDSPAIHCGMHTVYSHSVHALFATQNRHEKATELSGIIVTKKQSLSQALSSHTQKSGNVRLILRHNHNEEAIIDVSDIFVLKSLQSVSQVWS